jgi:hypothetical protein
MKAEREEKKDKEYTGGYGNPRNDSFDSMPLQGSIVAFNEFENKSTKSKSKNKNKRTRKELIKEAED